MGIGVESMARIKAKRSKRKTRESEEGESQKVMASKKNKQ